MVPRRTLLHALGLAITPGVAGCNTPAGDDPGTTSAQPHTPTATPSSKLTPTTTSPTPSPSTETPTETPTPSPTSSPTPSPTPTIAETRGTPGLTATAATNITEFGRAVALTADTAIVLAEGHGAFVFEQDDGWTQTTVLRPDDAEDFGAYNLSATMVGNVAMIGGPDADPEESTGTIYLFERIGGKWAQGHRLKADDDAERNEFGRSVDFDGDRVVVGDAHEPTTMVPWIGGAYVFVGAGSNWTQEAAIGTDAQDLFGTAVAIDGGDVLVGAPRAEPRENQVGMVYAYRRAGGNWRHRASLTPPESATSGLFGQAVDIDGDLAVIGAPGSESAYVFERQGDEWRHRARLATTATEPGSRFGQAVAIDGRTVVVGAPQDSGGGRAYGFTAADDWTRPRRLIGQESSREAEFGATMAAADEMALIGAPVFDATSAAYLFDLSSA